MRPMNRAKEQTLIPGENRCLLCGCVSAVCADAQQAIASIGYGHSSMNYTKPIIMAVASALPKIQGGKKFGIYLEIPKLPEDASTATAYEADE
jgi:hypothetical protein